MNKKLFSLHYVNQLGILALVSTLAVGCSTQQKSAQSSTTAPISNQVSEVRIAVVRTPASANQSSPEKKSQVRGRESIIQELNLGPDSTELWQKIQTLIANLGDMQDFSKLVRLFSLSITDSMETVSPKNPGLQYRTDAKDDRYHKLRSFGYAVGADSYEPKKRVVKLSINFDLHMICISNSEVRRLYGGGDIAIAGHGQISAQLYTDPTGVAHSESYGRRWPGDDRTPLIFSYSDSGCVESIHLQQPVVE